MPTNMDSTSNNKNNKVRVGYVFDRQLLALVNQLPELKSRALLVHQLIASYGLFGCCAKIPITPVSDVELRKFHTEEYIEFVKELSTLDDLDRVSDRCEEFGLSYDCPPIPRLYETISYLAASSISAAKAIVNGQCHIAVNWFGGWHHGQKDEASGFCYTNDIVFGILTFLENNFQRVLYIDLDLHHGNGVEDAFAYSNRVVSLSIHKHEFGFYPSTGDISDIGLGNRGKYHSINMPLADGISDHQYISIFHDIITRLVPKYRPQVMIVQCGADVLSGDRMNSFNLTLNTYERCIPLLLSYDIPLLLLGGGGYHPTNTARLWTYITALCVGKTDLDQNIPDHNLFLHYGPSYELAITASMIPNKNDEETIAERLQIISQNIEQMSDCK